VVRHKKVDHVAYTVATHLENLENVREFKSGQGKVGDHVILHVVNYC